MTESSPPDAAAEPTAASELTAAPAEPTEGVAEVTEVATAGPEVVETSRTASAPTETAAFPVPSPAALARTLRRQSAPPEPDPAEEELVARAREWGRVDDDGTVFVRTSDGERSVGSWQAGQPDAALAFYARRYEALVVELDLLEQRVRSGSLPADEAAGIVRRELGQVGSAQAVGDLDALGARLQGLRTLIDEQRQARRAERAKVLDEAKARKEALVADAERIGAGNDWRGGVEAMRQLLDTWKALPRLDRTTDDELWHRFSAARTSYTRRRKAHFSEQSERRDEAKERKEALAAEAEQLAGSTEWGATATRFRELMAQWKTAGPAWRADEETLWERFRAAQEAFFAARNATFDKRSSAETEAATAKESLLREAQALLPVRDLAAAKAALRGIQERWLSAGRVPRAAITRLEGGLHAVEEAIQGAERNEWQRTSPEALARAESTVSALQESITKLEAQQAKALAAGNDKAAREAASALETRRGWLASAEATLADFRR